MFVVLLEVCVIATHSHEHAPPRESHTRTQMYTLLYMRTEAVDSRLMVNAQLSLIEFLLYVQYQHKT